ncbi:hypothetical protein [Streptomyces sp. NPDC019224]|uniref:hypothetical protein n=1 Tax=Streptomyces sp. NPDC019224 TaxID=3154484 RepID=UPI0033E415A6
MAALTAAAVAVVGFLAYQASANVPDGLAAKPKASSSASAPAGKHAAPEPKKNPLAVPADSGTGTRVVYALKDRRVWLVNAKGKASRTFKVMPGSVSAVPGSYAVTSRSGSGTGSDGVPIEHVVRFAAVNDVTIGFSAAQDGAMEEPDPTVKAGGVRMSRADGDALWRFATVSVKVVVVP